MMKKIAIFASGSGTNAENIIKFFENKEDICIDIILSNKSDAYVLERAKNHQIDSVIFSKAEFNNSDIIKDLLISRNIDLIVLAGFLWLIPANLISAFPNKIINIHPALLPAYGGKGMYGMNVHEAVISNKEKQSGITIHYVNERYDEGQIILQAKFELNLDETPESLAQRIHKLEYEHFPKVIDQILG